MSKESLAFPALVRNHPAWRDILVEVFGYNAPFYDLEMYDRQEPGSGLRFWSLISKEREARVHGKNAIEGINC